MPGDIFGLRTNSSKIYDKQVDNTWQPFGGDYGYVAGGTYQSPPTTAHKESNIIRLDMTSETTSLPGADLHAEKWGVVGNAGKFGYGYFSGGYDPAPGYCTVDRLDFSTETISAPGNNFPTVFNRVFTVSNPEYGYVQNPGPTFRRIDFTTDSISSPPSNTQLTQDRSQGGSVFNENYGYFCGGAGDVCTVDRLDFSTESIAVPPVNSQLSLNRKGIYSTQSAKFGYLGGGSMPYNYSCIVDRLDFTTEVVNQMGPQASASHNPAYSAYPATRQGAGGMYNASNGYFAGGRNYIYSTEISSVTRMDFTTETTSFATNLPQKRTLVCGISGIKKRSRSGSDIGGKSISSTYGYFAGGFYSPPAGSRSTVDKIDFSSETTSAPGNNLSQARHGLVAVSSLNYGYFAGGEAPPYADTIERIDSSNETMSLPGNDLPQAKEAMMAVSNNNYGYFAGGMIFPPSTYYDTLNRIDLTHETISVPGNNLSNGKSRGAGVFNPNYGYFGSGIIGPGGSITATVDRIDFSTETISPGNNLPQGRQFLGSVSSSNYGYFGGGGYPYKNTVDKIDFSTETTDTASNNLPQARDGLAGVFNANYGYFGGGFAPPYKNTVDKIDFSTETTDTASNNLPQARSQLGAVSA